MYYIVEYGCSANHETICVKSDKKLKDIVNFAYHSAIEEFESYEGLHGILTFNEFCEEESYDTEDDEAWESYCEYRENDITYEVEEFDEKNEEHLAILINGCLEI